MNEFFSRVGVPLCLAFRGGFGRQAGTANKFWGTWRNCLRVILNFEVRDAASEKLSSAFLFVRVSLLSFATFSSQNPHLFAKVKLLQPRNRLFFSSDWSLPFERRFCFIRFRFTEYWISWKITLQRDFCGASTSSLAMLRQNFIALEYFKTFRNFRSRTLPFSKQPKWWTEVELWDFNEMNSWNFGNRCPSTNQENIWITNFLKK